MHATLQSTHYACGPEDCLDPPLAVLASSNLLEIRLCAAQLVAPIVNAPEEPPPGYKTIAEEIEEDKKRLAAEVAAAANAPKKAEKACFYCLEEFKK